MSSADSEIPAPFLSERDAAGTFRPVARLMLIHPRHIAGQNKRAAARKRWPTA